MAERKEDNFLLPLRGMGVWFLYYVNRALKKMGVIRAIKFIDGQIDTKATGWQRRRWTA